eukprot:c11750_g1_i2.p1 GENE.c11750_g1_i2~~c11750_g1_i2.p1  ORF type:complete len:192 (+),score=17.43 c11750_g1_i2:142-717(+)
MRHLPNARVQPLFYFHVCDDCPVQNGWTALHDAAWYGSCEIVNSLLSHGADVNALNHGSYTPLMYAIYRNNIEVADVLLAANPNLMACNMKRQTAYSMAVAFGRQKIASTIYEVYSTLIRQNISKSSIFFCHMLSAFWTFQSIDRPFWLRKCSNSSCELFYWARCNAESSISRIGWGSKVSFECYRWTCWG